MLIKFISIIISIKNLNSILLLLSLLNFHNLIAQEVGEWIQMESMNEPRYYHSVVVLQNGNILVTGGGSGSGNKSCEIYDMNTGQWRYTGFNCITKANTMSILLYTGKVLAMGSSDGRICELYDPDAETWSITDTALTPRFFGYTLTEMHDGKIMVCGGFNLDLVYPTQCEIFDPLTEQWESINPLNHVRADHSATLLNDGRIIVVGGKISGNVPINSCEIYNPNSDTWTSVSPLNTTRAFHTATLLQDDRVLVTGGRSLESNVFGKLRSCEIYDIQSDIWYPATDLHEPRAGHSIYFQEDRNQYIIVRGDNVYINFPDTWETYSADENAQTITGPFPAAFNYARSVKLIDSRIGIIGGREMLVIDGFLYYETISNFYTLDIVTSINAEKDYPDDFFLFQNYPNPFNPTTMISFSIPEHTNAVIKLYDTLGREVKELACGYFLPGAHQVQFNASNLASGVYLYTIRAGSFYQARKMLLLK